MAQITNAQLKEIFQERIAKIDKLQAQFMSELARFKADRQKILDAVIKQKDDEKIKEILRSIK